MPAEFAMCAARMEKRILNGFRIGVGLLEELPLAPVRRATKSVSTSDPLTAYSSLCLFRALRINTRCFIQFSIGSRALNF